ncbi:MAG: hypothetical protein ABEJ86_07140 [Halococcoides sp.]
MSSLARVRETLAMGLREYARTPVLVGLLVVLPAYFVGVFVLIAPDTTVPLTIDGTRTTATLIAIYGALLVPTVGALIGGIAGLFVTLSATEADRRLTIAGLDPVELLAARFSLVAAAGALGVAVATGVLAVTVVPADPAAFVLAGVLCAVIYGLLGTLAGLVVGRLAGVYLMLLAPMMDIVFFQNPMVEDAHWVASVLPGRFVADLAIDAAIGGSIALDPLGPAILECGAIGVLAAFAYYGRITA